MKLKDKVTGDVTDGYQFDGQDEGGTLRDAIRNKPSVEPGAEVVVGSWRLYLPQRVHQIVGDGYDYLTEIVERGSWVIWNDEDEQWVIYPDPLKIRYFEELPDGDA